MSPPPPAPTVPSATDSPASTTSSSSASQSSDINYRRFPLLLPLCKELSNSAITQSTAARKPLRSQMDVFATAPRLDVNPSLNSRPVIGILSHPGDGASGRLSEAANISYIASSYVKFVECAGARVITLIYNEPWEVIFRKLSLVNGVIFTGGWAKSGLYREVVESIFKDNTILERFNAVDQSSTLQFVENIDMNGTLFHRFPPSLLKKLQIECLLMQHHKFGISPEKFTKNKKLSGFFKIITTSADEDGKVYVSTVQARRYPVTAVQWHPELFSVDTNQSFQL